VAKGSDQRNQGVTDWKGEAGPPAAVVHVPRLNASSGSPGVGAQQQLPLQVPGGACGLGGAGWWC